METKNLRVKSIELALQLPDNTTHAYNMPNGTFYSGGNMPTTLKKQTDSLLEDAEKIYNFLTKTQ